MKSSSKSATKVIRVLIADDHPVVREGLVRILKSENDIKVVAEAADGKETCELYNELAPRPRALANEPSALWTFGPKGLGAERPTSEGNRITALHPFRATAKILRDCGVRLPTNHQNGAG
jgi:CheY-like chemotaxis protein